MKFLLSSNMIIHHMSNGASEDASEAGAPTSLKLE
jgi:hypothetical protein